MTGATPEVVVVSDVLVDVTEQDDGRRTAYPGGAGFNLAVDVARLGVRTALAAPAPPDALGQALRRRLHSAGVDVIALPADVPTGVVTSRRTRGEPTYAFSPSMFARRYRLQPEHRAAAGTGAVVVVNSFPYEHPDQVDAVLELVTAGRHRLVVDPNVRPALVADVAAYRAGFRRTARHATLVKVSAQDVADLGLDDPDGLFDELLDEGPSTVVLTRAAYGATLRTADGTTVHAAIPARPEPVVDTMGAGDAVLARLVTELVRGSGASGPDWARALREAMELAADVCRVAGGCLENAPLEQEITQVVEGVSRAR